MLCPTRSTAVSVEVHGRRKCHISVWTVQPFILDGHRSNCMPALPYLPISKYVGGFVLLASIDNRLIWDYLYWIHFYESSASLHTVPHLPCRLKSFKDLNTNYNVKFNLILTCKTYKRIWFTGNWFIHYMYADNTSVILDLLTYSSTCRWSTQLNQTKPQKKFTSLCKDSGYTDNS